jgi:hypothetical protein
MHRLAILLLLIAAAPLSARDLSGYMMMPSEELRLAATAAPAAVTEKASYYVLTPDGFELEIKGANGWHCFVERAFFVRTAGGDEYDPDVRAPHCINEEGAATRMQEVFMRARLALEGLERETVDAEINKAFQSGTLRPPSGFAMTYMMSAEQWLGEGAGHWHPHLMFWVPYLENADVGGNAPMGVLPFIGGESGSRSAVLIVAVPPLEPPPPH